MGDLILPLKVQQHRVSIELESARGRTVEQIAATFRIHLRDVRAVIYSASQKRRDQST